MLLLQSSREQHFMKILILGAGQVGGTLAENLAKEAVRHHTRRPLNPTPKRNGRPARHTDDRRLGITS